MISSATDLKAPAGQQLQVSADAGTISGKDEQDDQEDAHDSLLGGGAHDVGF